VTVRDVRVESATGTGDEGELLRDVADLLDMDFPCDEAGKGDARSGA
tara:strand:- start:344 stop:484 length:141 start_codon:yes stop_codon:yes gene_type:complete